MTTTEPPTPRDLVDKIPSTPRNDQAIAAATQNAAELGLTEDQDEFWIEVLGQVADEVSR